MFSIYLLLLIDNNFYKNGYANIFNMIVENSEISKDDVINIIVGDLQRMKEYPEKGFQIVQKIPESVWQAYEKLVDLGYNKHLMKK